MRHLVRVAAAMSLMAGAAACAEGAAQQGPEASRRFPVTAFTQIDSAGAFHVQVTTGQAPSMIATGLRRHHDQWQCALQRVEDGQRSRPLLVISA